MSKLPKVTVLLLILIGFVGSLIFVNNHPDSRTINVAGNFVIKAQGNQYVLQNLRAVESSDFLLEVDVVSMDLNSEASILDLRGLKVKMPLETHVWPHILGQKHNSLKIEVGQNRSDPTTIYWIFDRGDRSLIEFAKQMDGNVEFSYDNATIEELRNLDQKLERELIKP